MILIYKRFLCQRSVSRINSISKISRIRKCQNNISTRIFFASAYFWMILTRIYLGFRYAKSSAQKMILKRAHLGFRYAKSSDQKRFSSATMHFDTYVIFISSQCCIPNVYHFTQKTLNLRSHSNTTESGKISPSIFSKQN